MKDKQIKVSFDSRMFFFFLSPRGFILLSYYSDIYISKSLYLDMYSCMCADAAAL